MLIRTKSDELFVRDGGVWNEERGQRVIRFIESFLVLESGQPFRLLDWQKEFIRCVYCWEKDGLRRIKLALLTLARKNGKSALTFGLTAYHLIADGEQSPSCVSCACTKEQAGQIYDWFRFAVENNPKLSSALRCTASRKTIHYPKRNGTYRSLASEANANFGHGHSFVIYDELAFHRKDDLYIALKNSTDARPNGLQVITSTSGWNKNGAFFKLTQYAKKVLSGEVIDTTFSPHVFETPATADLDDESNWHLANPSLGITQSIADFRHQWHRERQDATSKLAFQRLKFNMWTDAENSWIAPETWDSCQGNATIPDGSEVYVGVDIGATRDLTAITLVAPQQDKSFKVRTVGFVPEAALQTRDGVNTVVYQSCVKHGDLRLTKGNATDEKAVIAHLDELRSRYKVLSVTFDKWQSLTLSNHLAQHNVTVFGFPQTHSYFNAPCLELEKLVNTKRITHDGSPLLRWQIGHTYLDRDSKGYVKPTTSRPENKKDNLISLLMALSQALQAGTVQAKPSVYETRGLFVLGTR